MTLFCFNSMLSDIVLMKDGALEMLKRAMIIIAAVFATANIAHAQSCTFIAGNAVCASDLAALARVTGKPANTIQVAPPGPLTKSNVDLPDKTKFTNNASNVVTNSASKVVATPSKVVATPSQPVNVDPYKNLYTVQGYQTALKTSGSCSASNCPYYSVATKNAVVSDANGNFLTSAYKGATVKQGSTTFTLAYTNTVAGKSVYTYVKK